MATAEDDGIEILSCHIEHEDEVTETSTSVSVKVANGKTNEDPVSKHRKRVARVVAIVTFILLLFSVVLIGVSLNMSKNIDEMASTNAMDKPGRHYKPPPPKVKVTNVTDLNPDLEPDLQH